MAAVAEACRSGKLDAHIQVVVAPKEDAPAAIRARELGLTIKALAPASDTYAEDIVEALSGCDLVCLSGYLRLLPAEVLRAHHGRILNIHPSLLPKFGGKGMYMHHVHQAVLDAGETETGCTVHVVTEHYDEGRILLQKKCPVLKGDTVETLSARVSALENVAFVEAIQGVLSNQT